MQILPGNIQEGPCRTVNQGQGEVYRKHEQALFLSSVLYLHADRSCSYSARFVSGRRSRGGSNASDRNKRAGCGVLASSSHYKTAHGGTIHPNEGKRTPAYGVAQQDTVRAWLREITFLLLIYFSPWSCLAVALQDVHPLSGPLVGSAQQILQSRFAILHNRWMPFCWNNS